MEKRAKNGRVKKRGLTDGKASEPGRILRREGRRDQQRSGLCLDPRVEGKIKRRSGNREGRYRFNAS